MRIAVIGDYKSPGYIDLLMKVTIFIEDVFVLDLSKHNTGSWTDMRDARWADIESAHQVIVCNDWLDQNIDVKVDIQKARCLGKELLVFYDGYLIPLQLYAYKG